MTESDILWQHSYGKKLPERSFCFFKDLNEALSELERLKAIVGHSRTNANEINRAMGYDVVQVPKPMVYSVGYSGRDIQEKAEVVAYNTNPRFSDVNPIYMIKMPKAKYIITI